VGALLALAATPLYVLANGDHLASIGALLGTIGFVLLALGLVLRWPSTVPWAVLLAGMGYLVGRLGTSVVDGWAAAIGVLLLAAAELASWSIEHDARIHAEPSLVLRRAATLLALLTSALFVNFLLIGTAGVAAPESVLLIAVGVGASVAALAFVLRLARS
jgi:hypothetical protein